MLQHNDNYNPSVPKPIDISLKTADMVYSLSTGVSNFLRPRAAWSPAGRDRADADYF